MLKKMEQSIFGGAKKRSFASVFTSAIDASDVDHEDFPVVKRTLENGANIEHALTQAAMIVDNPSSNREYGSPIGSPIPIHIHRSNKGSYWDSASISQSCNRSTHDMRQTSYKWIRDICEYYCPGSSKSVSVGTAAIVFLDRLLTLKLDDQETHDNSIDLLVCLIIAFKFDGVFELDLDEACQSIVPPPDKSVVCQREIEILSLFGYVLKRKSLRTILSFLIAERAPESIRTELISRHQPALLSQMHADDCTIDSWISKYSIARRIACRVYTALGYWNDDLERLFGYPEKLLEFIQN